MNNLKARKQKMPNHCGNCRWASWDEWLRCHNPFVRFEESMPDWFGHYEVADLEGIEVKLEPQWWDADDEGVSYDCVCDGWDQLPYLERVYEYRPLLTSEEADEFHKRAVKWIRANCD